MKGRTGCVVGVAFLFVICMVLLAGAGMTEAQEKRGAGDSGNLHPLPRIPEKIRAEPKNIGGQKQGKHVRYIRKTGREQNNTDQGSGE